MDNQTHDEIIKNIQLFFKIEDLTIGDNSADYIYRFRGQFLTDYEQAHNALFESLSVYRMIPVFRRETTGEVIYLRNAPNRSVASRNWVNLLLFVLTTVSVVYTGMGYTEEKYIAGLSNTTEITFATLLHGGLPFAFSLLAILLAHEFGHYFAARHHKTIATLPYFLPFPTLLGTLGAVIIWKDTPRNKKVVFDVGIAGPIAGLILSIPIVVYGLSISSIGPINPGQGGFVEGNSIFYLFAKYLVFGKLLPQPTSYGDLGPILYWVKYFFTGLPIISSGTDVFISPVAMAGWAGLLVTSLNLLPVGQLDGGHVIGALLGTKKKAMLPIILLALAVMGFFWNGWWLWLAMLWFTGNRDVEPLDGLTEIDPIRKRIAFGLIIVFLLVFMPVPLIPLG